ncbi:hypothetical protein AMATHDRAFT_143252 [Amanita thiersii Skay4041]|uniref:F-box domain-containing protein n=1 Tax=Amanita thiersii Skay4041 TaxID=703135 RepID=A0A2A9NU14_9AGAR|nr:hypothetical protein AMATHDRAFT_143252 [Amanita thiersii Skay4041]
MHDLPPEIVLEILSQSIVVHPQPAAILVTSSFFYHSSVDLLYRNLYFKSRNQLIRFLRTYSNAPFRIARPPRSIELDFDSGMTTNIFYHIGLLFVACSFAPSAEVDTRSRVVVDLLKLRLHSHSQDPYIGSIYDALASVNPRRFVWTGRDPPHHFSIAAIPHLIRAFSTYTYLSHLELTHLSFSGLGDDFRFPIIPSLRALILGQATFLSPSIIASYVLMAGKLHKERCADVNAETGDIEQIHLVDAYKESIWGLRLRRSDIEKAVATHVTVRAMDEDEVVMEHSIKTGIELVRRLVVCEGKTERIMGGDRVMDHISLLL